MRLPRPHIQEYVRFEVLARQLTAVNPALAFALSVIPQWHNIPIGTINQVMLAALFGNDWHNVHLDHDPPLMLRQFNSKTGKYKPDANDPRFLVYRTAEEHRIKTFVRGDGAQLSDAAKRRKEIRRVRKLKSNVLPFKPPSRWPPKGSRPLRPKPTNPKGAA